LKIIFKKVLDFAAAGRFTMNPEAIEALQHPSHKVNAMKISEFAAINNVTTKMLRYYDEMGLLKPAATDAVTGYRSYEADQSRQLDWILILKDLAFPLGEIRAMLSGPIDSMKLIHDLAMKRLEIGSNLNEQIQKKIQIDKLIRLWEREGFHMDAKIDLMRFEKASVHDIKKNMPNMELFLESVQNILSACMDTDPASVLRFDISHFKRVNDTYGFDVGDNVIVACYDIIRASFASLGGNMAIGRAHGDEFVVFAKCGRDDVTRMAEQIVRGMESFDFSSIGCGFAMNCQIGVLVARKGTLKDIRQTIDDTAAAVEEARKKGPGSLVVRSA
jgi:diguanylate cyclase (GGDEF)-like protein